MAVSELLVVVRAVGLISAGGAAAVHRDRARSRSSRSTGSQPQRRDRAGLASTEETTASTEEVAASSEQLATTAEHLRQLINRFTVSVGGARSRPRAAAHLALDLVRPPCRVAIEGAHDRQADQPSSRHARRCRGRSGRRSVPSCAEGGVFGILCAAIGSVQSTEAIKLLLGIGEPLTGRLLVHDALRQTWDTLTVRADPACPACGDAPTLTSSSTTSSSAVCRGRRPAARATSRR